MIQSLLIQYLIADTMFLDPMLELSIVFPVNMVTMGRYSMGSLVLGTFSLVSRTWFAMRLSLSTGFLQQ